MMTLPEDTYARKARLKAVVDGDTVRLTLDLGFRHYQEHSIRLQGVEAPNLHRGTEEDRLAAKECRQYVIKWFERHKTMCGTHYSWPFIIQTQNSESFGRYLGIVYCMAGHILNDDVLSSGLAQPYQKRNQNE